MEQEDFGRVGAHLILGLLVDPFELVGRGLESAVEPGDLRGDLVGGDLASGDPPMVLLKDKDMPDDDSGRDRDALDDVHSDRVPFVLVSPCLVSEGRGSTSVGSILAGTPRASFVF